MHWIQGISFDPENLGPCTTSSNQLVPGQARYHSTAWQAWPLHRHSTDTRYQVSGQVRLDGDEIEDLLKMGFDFGRFVSDLQY